MQILWVLAHPDTQSLNGQLRDAVLPRLRDRGHQITQSDLYRMGFDPVLDSGDLTDGRPCEGTPISSWQADGYREGRLADDIRTEQQKLRRADLVVLQFPLWWFGPPAILKGWFDRVLVNGFAFGVRDQHTGRVRKYGDGGLVGRRGMALLTAGDRDTAMGPRGISGHPDDILYPLLHGIFHYTGIEPLRSHLLSSVHHWPPGQFQHEVDRLVNRIDGAGSEAPLQYRTLAGGDYDPNTQELRAEIEPGRTGSDIHRLDPIGG